MTIATVSNLDNMRLIREGEQAVDQYNRGLKNARASIMPMARGLCAAKHEYPATQDFGDWLHTSAYREIEKDDRAALIKIGEHEDFAAKYMRTTRLISPESIWDAMRDLLPTSEVPNSTSTPPPIPESPPAIAQTHESAESPAPKPTPKTAPPITSRSSFYEAPRAQEIATKLLDKKARATLSHVWDDRNGKHIWELITIALDAGLLVESAHAIKKPTMHLLFPPAPLSYARHFDLTNPRQRKQIKEEILPAMIACRDQLLASPDNMATILSAYQAAQAAQQVAAVKTERHATAVRALPLAEQELVMFGQPVWPRPNGNQGEYTYDQARAAIWTFRDYEAWNVMAKEDVESFAKRIRNSQRYLGEFVRRTDREQPIARVYSLIMWFSRLMEKNPTAECKWPMYPHIEGQW